MAGSRPIVCFLVVCYPEFPSTGARLAREASLVSAFERVVEIARGLKAYLNPEARALAPCPGFGRSTDRQLKEARRGLVRKDREFAKLRELGSRKSRKSSSRAEAVG